MTILSASTVGLRTLADGTVRVTVDIEPNLRTEAFELLGTPGRSIAIAALKDGHGQVKIEDQQKPAGASYADLGPLCREALDMCKNVAFYQFIAVEGWDRNEEGAKKFILHCCNVESRKDIDGNAEAARIFRTRVRSGFQQWLRDQQEG